MLEHVEDAELDRLGVLLAEPLQVQCHPHLGRLLGLFAAAAAEEAEADAAAVVDPDGAVPWWSESDSESLENSGSGMLKRAMRRFSSS